MDGRRIAVSLLLGVLAGAFPTSATTVEIAAPGLQLSMGAAFDGRYIAFVRSEASFGEDLNGDGDQVDPILHVYDGETESVTSLGLAVDTALSIASGVLAFAVNERDQGDTDLDGDGSVGGKIAHVHDLASGQTTNLRLREIPTARGELVVLDLSEGRLDADLNGDGDKVDSILHVYDIATQTLHVLPFALENFHPFGTVSGSRVSFAVRERFQGETDLNGDGDSSDSVAHVFDARTGVTKNLGLHGRPSLTSEMLVVAVGEGPQGATDLNGDLDFADDVVHVHDLKSGRTTNLGVAGSATGVDGFLSLSVREIDQGNTDLNGDGVIGGLILFVYDNDTGQLTNVGEKLNQGRRSTSSSLVAFLILEGDRGVDLNGDGDLGDPAGGSRFGDPVLHVYHRCSGRLTNVGLASSDPNDVIQAIDQQVLFGVHEMWNGRGSLNGDEDLGDIVAHVYDANRHTGVGPPSRGITNTGIAVPTETLIGRISGSVISSGFRPNFRMSVIHAWEQGENADLNADGDLDDAVAHLYDPRSQTLHNLGLASPTAGFFGVSGFALFDDLSVLLTVSETEQGNEDLDGDGVVGGRVGYLARLDPGPPAAAGTVNSGVGPITNTLFVNGAADRLETTVGTPLEFRLDAPPQGPVVGPYMLWVWLGPPTNEVETMAGGEHLGYTVNPTPLEPGRCPQPFACLRATTVPNLACGAARTFPSPSTAPWTIVRSSGVPNPGFFLLQGVQRDLGADNGLGFSVTNAVELVVE